ncbi:STAS domain-containing protein [Blastococcus sp. SYSU D00820]
MQFEVERMTVHGQPGLRVRGELDIATAPDLAAAVDAELAAGARSLVLDLAETTFLDSSGARQLALTARQAGAGDVRLQVVCPRGNRPVRMVIDMLELDRVVPVVETATFVSGDNVS